MKVVYRGFEIEAKREMCMAGYKLLYFSIFRQEDRWEMNSGYTEGSDRIQTFIRYLKESVDECIENPKSWDDPKLREE